MIDVLGGTATADAQVDSEESCDRAEREAKRGLAQAQFQTATCYDRAQGRPQDYGIAREWFEKAVRQGHADAMNDLGVMYQVGNGVTANMMVACALWERGAEIGGVWAATSLATCYDSGRGVKRYPADAFHRRQQRWGRSLMVLRRISAIVPCLKAARGARRATPSPRFLGQDDAWVHQNQSRAGS
jgi:hypothetical protein